MYGMPYSVVRNALAALIYFHWVKSDPLKLPSILTPDPSSGLVLLGRTLDVVRAVTRNEATKLKEEGRGNGRRWTREMCTCSAKEVWPDVARLQSTRLHGSWTVIVANSPVVDSLPAEEEEKRTNSFNASRNLLKTNPPLYVSKTRLSVRQIPAVLRSTCSND